MTKRNQNMLLITMAIVIAIQLLLASYSLIAQPLNAVKGKISDEKGQPLPGATIRVKGTTLSAISSIEGEFTIKNAPVPLTLSVSYLGYKNKEITVKQAGVFIHISLQPADNVLKEIVVSTGYQQVPSERVTGSVTVIDHQLLNRRVSSDILSRIEDVASGVLMDRREGGSPKLDIRSRGTLFASDQPLIVLDNFPYEGDLNSINPNDIASITVLKDAAAASIWGVRASNGVIVVTTKKGAFNQPLRVELNSSVTMGEKPNFGRLPWITSADYISLEKVLFAKGYYTGDEQFSSNTPLTPVVETLIAQRDGLLTSDQAEKQLEAFKLNNVRNDFQRYLYRNSTIQQYALNLQGGTNKHRYYFAAGYDRNQASVKQNRNDRLSIRAANTFLPLKGLELNVDLTYTQSNAQTNGLAYTDINSGGAGKSIYPYARLVNGEGVPAAITKNYRNSFLNEAQSKGLLNWQYYPLHEIEQNDNTSKTGNIRLNAGIKYSFFKSLNGEFRYTYQHAQTDQRNLYNPESYYTRDLINRFTNLTNGTLTRPIPLGGIIDQGVNTLQSDAARGQLNFEQQSGNHHLSALAGMEVRRAAMKGSGNRNYGYNDQLLTYSSLIDYSTSYTLYNGNSGYIPFSNYRFSDKFDGAVSYYTNAAYTYANRYTLSASARLDQTNLFGVKTNQKGVPLWSVGASWAIDKESFYQSDWLPGLKLRLTYGYNGNVDKSLSAYTTALFSGSTAPAGFANAGIVNPPNPELRWEKTGILNAGIDFVLKNNVLWGSIEYYTKKGTDLIGEAPVDATTGITSFKGNVAAISGKGLDLVINAQPLDGDFKWNSSVLFSYAADKVTDYLLEATKTSSFLGDGSLTRNGAGISPLVGRPVYGVYSYRWAGLDPATGDPQGYLPDGIISKDYVALLNIPPKDLVYHGPARPPIFGSFRNTFTWKNLLLSANLTYRFGHYFHQSSVNYSALFSTWNGNKDYAARWQQPGDERFTDVPSLVYPASPARDAFYNGAQQLVQKADHIRLQDVTLGYQLNKKSWPALPLQNLKFYLQANNLGLLWTANKKGIDPDYPVLPAVRSVALGLTASF